MLQIQHQLCFLVCLNFWCIKQFISYRQLKYVMDSTPVMLLSVSLFMMYQTIHSLQATQVCDGFNTSYIFLVCLDLWCIKPFISCRQLKYVIDSTPVMLLSVSLFMTYQTIHFLQATQVCDGFNTSYIFLVCLYLWCIKQFNSYRHHKYVAESTLVLYAF